MRTHELSTEKICSIIDELTEAGCLYLLLTGGEPLMRKDFAKIYTYAKERGLLITVFTNGTLITDDVVTLFKDLPPRFVEISLYGATPLTYEMITGIHGSFQRCMDGIQSLLDHQINVRLKTILMTPNRHEFYEIKRIAEDFGVEFRFDAGIFPTLDGDLSPMLFRVSPEEAIEKEFADPEKRDEWQEFYDRYHGVPLLDTLYQCGAGVSNFHIDPYGHLQPCLMTSVVQYNLRDGAFSSGWYDVIPKIRERKIKQDHPCSDCETITMCGYCPAFFDLENGLEEQPSDYLCSIGHLRFQEIIQLSENHYEKRG
ncbi:MAG: radical SAM protein [Anaerolineales bacterium]|nr:radical SAM protein [Anaerolineales bacterium]